MKLLFSLVLVMFAATLESISAADKVQLLRTPEKGIQPQAAIDGEGRVHLIFYAGDPGHGDIWYTTTQADATEFSKPIRVNSQDGSAVAAGNIRGAQLALGSAGRVHVVWNGSGQALPQGVGKNPFLYARSKPDHTGFEEQRNLITWAGGLDGGGSVAADPERHVYVAWHAMGSAKDEAGRGVYLTRSSDEGTTFDKERQIDTQIWGACGCCGMKLHLTSDGFLYAAYRSARHNRDRDATLLFSTDGGETFKHRNLGAWQAFQCPMTSFSFADHLETPVVAWETNGQVSFQFLTDERATIIASRPIIPRGIGLRKHPALAVNTDGEILLAWTEGMSFGRSGSLAWQVFDRNGEITKHRGRMDGVRAHSLITGIAKRDGNFLLVY